MVSSFIVIGLLSFLNTYSASAAMRSVPSDYSTIQKAINAAQNGDEVVVAPGTYRENIEIVNKYITVRALADYNVTVIAGNPGKTPVMIQNVPYRPGGKTQLSGFRITGGYAPDGQGGGITIANNADPIISSNKIEDNQSLSQGGGILIFNNSNPHIRNNVIQNNKAKMFGGGVFAVKNSSPTISENFIRWNSVSGASISNGGSSGGGIYLENDTSNANARSKPIVFQNIIQGNSADFAGGGIMLRVGVDAIIENNTISGNSASYGGGVHVETEGSNPVISNNWIDGNSAGYKPSFPGSGHGGGISVYASSKPTISSNTISNNHSSKGGAGMVIAENARVTASGNTINGNLVVDTGAEGGGIYIANAYASLFNNLVYQNTATLGGGLALMNNSKSDIQYNTFHDNRVSNTYGGGGIFIVNNSGITSNILSNIITQNQKYQIFEDTTHVRIDNNVITNSGTGLYYSYNTNAINSATSLNNSSGANAANNVDGDPSFIDAGNADYHLGSNSSAINLALGGGIYEDKDKIVRPISGSPDAGAYEYNDGSGVVKSNVYRFWSDSYKGHFFTVNSDEKNGLIFSSQPSEWRYEGVAYGSYSAQISNSVPLYRFWSDANHGHFYTINSAEKDHIIASYPSNVWQYEGIAYYVYPLSYSSNILTVDRFWSDTYKHHFFTASADESLFVRQNLSNTWIYEGNRFNVPQ